MEGDVKALINLKDGTIQLEGPQDFVEKYLDKYHPIIEKGAKSASIPEKKEEENEGEKAIQKRTRTAKSKAGPTCGEKIRELINEGFFKEPKTGGQITEHLKSQKGLIYLSKDVAANLKRLFDKGNIKRITEGGVFKYYVNV